MSKRKGGGGAADVFAMARRRSHICICVSCGDQRGIKREINRMARRKLKHQTRKLVVELTGAERVASE